MGIMRARHDSKKKTSISEILYGFPSSCPKCIRKLEGEGITHCQSIPTTF